MSVYSVPLGRDAGAGVSGPTVFFTAPVGYTTVLRDVTMGVTPGGDIETVIEFPDGTYFGFRLDNIAGTHRAAATTNCRLVMPPGTKLASYSPAGGFWSTVCSGYNLS